MSENIEKVIPNVDSKSKEERNVPDLRFSNDPWHKELLAKNTTFLKGNGYSKSDLSNDGVPCILYGQLYTTYLSEIIDHVTSKTSHKIKNPVYSKINDVIIPASGETPEDIATACCIIDDGIILGGDLNILRLKNHNGAFLSYQLNSKRKYDIAKLAVGKSVVHLHNNDLEKLEVYYPMTRDYEDKVVNLLYLIDNRINTQKKIINVLESQMKSISSLIYKRADSNIELAQIATFERKTNHKSEDGLDFGLYPFYTNEEVQTKYFDSYDYDGLYILANTGGKANFKLVDGKFAVMSDTLVIKFNNANLAKTYINYFVNNKMKINNDYFAGSGLKHLDKNSFSKLKLPILNSDIDSLNDFFEALTKRINLNKKILLLLEKQKQYLLDKMFI